jgi:hypothetical protein
MFFVPKPPNVVWAFDVGKLKDVDPLTMKPSYLYGPSPQPLQPTTFHLGRCRRHSPTMSGWPVVFVNDWCGDHKLDENKVGEEKP